MRKMYFKIVFCLMIFIFAVIGSGFCTDQPLVKFYDLDVGFYPDARMDYAGLIEVLEGIRPEWNKVDSMNSYPHMKGKVEVTIDLGDKSQDSLVFYLHSELGVHQILTDKRELKYNQEIVYYRGNYSRVANQVKINVKDLTGKQDFTIVYGGVFSSNYAGAPSNYMRIDTEGVYLRAYGYSLWFPIFLNDRENSQPIEFRAKITTPKKFIPVLTGERISEKIYQNHRISFWQGNGIELYYMQVAARPYEIIQKEGIHIYHLPLPKSKRASNDILNFIQKLKVSFEDNFKKITNTSQIHIAELPNFASGISSGNMMGMTSGQWQNFSLKSDDGLKLLVAHELIHSYVRVKVDNKNPLSSLIMEGFPSYFHFHVLADMIGEDWYQRYMGWVEDAYLRRKKTKKTRWGSTLPVEKPILSITYEEIGEYKDTFVLNDRVRLFLNYLRMNLGKKEFKKFTRELFQRSGLTVKSFKNLIQKYLPGTTKDINLWLESNDYPQRFQLKKIIK